MVGTGPGYVGPYLPRKTRLMWSFVFRWWDQECDANGLSQETFLKAFQKRKGGSASAAPLTYYEKTLTFMTIHCWQDRIVT